MVPRSPLPLPSDSTARRSGFLRRKMQSCRLVALLLWMTAWWVCDGEVFKVDMDTPAEQQRLPLKCSWPTNVLDSFDIDRVFEKKWYEVRYTHSSKPLATTRCHSLVLEPSNEDYDLQFPPEMDGTEVSTRSGAFALLRAYDPNSQSDLKVKMYVREAKSDNETLFISWVIGQKDTELIIFWVLATDYTNYLVLRICGPSTDNWDLQDRELANEFLSEVQVALVAAGVQLSTLENSDQTGCTREQHGPGCPDVPIMKDFDIARYTGSWHDVLVTDNLDHTSNKCYTHVISAASGTVSYFEKIYNPILDRYEAMQGTVKVDSPGKLQVTSPGTSEAKDYWVVDTDYVSYSVVYSCSGAYGDDPIVHAVVLSRSFEVSSLVKRQVEALVKDKLKMILMPKSNFGCVPDTCPPLTPTQQDLDHKQLAGTWYGIWHSGPSEVLCSSYMITPSPSGSLFVLQEAPKLPDDAQPNAGISVKEAVPVDQSAHDGRFVFRRPHGIHDVFNILGVSYNQWAVVSVCEPQDNDRPVKMFTTILARHQKDCSPNSDDKLRLVLRVHNMRESDFKLMLPPMCPRPSCIDSIQVVPTLDPLQLRGLWHVIEETPVADSTGFCTTHYFTPEEGKQDRLRLDITEWNPTTRGDYSNKSYSLVQENEYAVGKFNVTAMPNTKDVFRKFWIIDSDGSNYVMAYSCSEMDGGRSRARTWVLHRSAYMNWKEAAKVVDAYIRGHVDLRSMREVEHRPLYCKNAQSGGNPGGGGGGGDDHTPPNVGDNAFAAARPSVAFNVLVLLSLLVAAGLR